MRQSRVLKKQYRLDDGSERSRKGRGPNSSAGMFELRVVPVVDGTYRLSLLEYPAFDSQQLSERGPIQRSSLRGWHLQITEGSVRIALEESGYKPGDLRWSRRAPFRLNEEEGMRLDLLFRSITGLNKRTKIEDLILGLRHMGREEVAYWHAKITRDNGTTAANGLHAFRTLLGGP